jgi:hypothetical protein
VIPETAQESFSADFFAQPQEDGQQTRPEAPAPESLFDVLFSLERRRKPGDPAEYRPVFPLLANMKKFWESDELFPVLPFACGNPNTAVPGGCAFSDFDGQELSPIFTPVKFVEQAQGRDLFAKYNEIMKPGQKPKAGAVPEGLSEDDQVLMSVPKRIRRPSF